MAANQHATLNTDNTIKQVKQYDQKININKLIQVFFSFSQYHTHTHTHTLHTMNQTYGRTWCYHQLTSHFE